MSLTRVWITACAAALVVTLQGPAAAQDRYPSRPVTIVVPFGAGSVTDVVTRRLAAFLEQEMKASYIIEAKPGSGGMIGALQVARAAPDGYTLLVTTNTTHSVVYGFYKNVLYDPIKDFTPIARFGGFTSLLVVNPEVPAKNVDELVAYGKANPGKLECAYGNSTGNIACSTFKNKTGIDMVTVAYRANPQAMTDLLGGQVRMMVSDLNTALPHIRSGKIRVIATLNKERSTILPEVPTLAETLIPGFDVLAWVGMFGPAGMPQALVDRYDAAIAKFIAMPENVEALKASGCEITSIRKDAFPDFVKAEIPRYNTLISEAGIKPE